MDLDRLHKHVKLCKRNLRSEAVHCCAHCPFEEEITNVYPELKKLFIQKRKILARK